MSITHPALAASSLTFDDEFNGFDASPDGSSGWMTALPYGGESARTLPGNHEAEYYSDPSVGEDPFALSNGILTIAAMPAAAGSNPYNLPYDSGLITSYKSFSQLYGYFEVRAQLPAGSGLWPAFWLLPANNVYSSELDVFEVLGSDPTTLYATTHGATGGVWSSNSQAFKVADTAAGFHTYGVDWEPATITFYMDGQEIGAAPTPATMDVPMYVLLDLAVGGPGSWPGSPTGSTAFPADMEIDYVRAYATAATRDLGGSQAIAGATPLPSFGPPPPPVSLGAGPDKIVLSVSEDAWQGDAQYTVAVDGAQVGGVATATASHAAGQDQTVTIAGHWGAGPHTVAVDFLNDAYGGTPETDRNLYVDSTSYDGVAATPGTLALMSGGTQYLTVSAPPPPDKLVLTMAEDAWNGDAQFTVSIDGTQVGGTQTVTATHDSGQRQAFAFTGNFGLGEHTVAVTFLNPTGSGTTTAERNLYLGVVTFDGHSNNVNAVIHSGTRTLAIVSATRYALGAAGGVVDSVGADTITTGSGAATIYASGPSATIVLGSGTATISALAGNDTVTAGSGRLTFLQGTGTDNVKLGGGAALFDIAAGSAGGNLSVANFVPGLDAIHLSGYTGSGIASENFGGKSAHVTLSDNTHITLADITGPSGIFA